jgi:hypothetical protein
MLQRSTHTIALQYAIQPQPQRLIGQFDQSRIDAWKLLAQMYQGAGDAVLIPP